MRDDADAVARRADRGERRRRADPLRRRINATLAISAGFVTLFATRRCGTRSGERRRWRA